MNFLFFVELVFRPKVTLILRNRSYRSSTFVAIGQLQERGTQSIWWKEADNVWLEISDYSDPEITSSSKQQSLETGMQK